MLLHFSVLSFVLFFAGVYLISAGTIISSVNIGNSGPSLDQATCSCEVGCTNGGANIYSPPAGGATNYTIACSARVSDANGYQDVMDAGSYFYTYMYTQGQANMGSANPDFAMQNLSCANQSRGGTQIIYNCSMKLPYWADNGTWVVNFTSTDGTTDNYTTLSITINPLQAAQFSSSVSFGTVSLNINQTLATSIRFNNTGNYLTDLNIYGDTNFVCYTGTTPNGNTFAIGWLHYNLTNAQAFFDGCAMGTTAASTCMSVNTSFNLGDCEGTYCGPNGVNSSLLYTGIGIPPSGALGTCNASLTPQLIGNYN